MRDELSQRVADNLVDLLARRGMKVNHLQTRINDARPGTARSSTVSDFLKGPIDETGKQRARSSSLKVLTLSEIAAGLEIDPIAFFLPPDRRDQLMSLIDTLYTVPPESLVQIRQIVESFQPKADD